MKKISVIILLNLAVCLLLSFEVYTQKTIIKQGHRGCRGLMPENTIPAMIKALDKGVHVLELDVVISKDNKVVVSHNPYMSAEFSKKPSGDTVSSKEQYDLLLYNMYYEEIRLFDVGSKRNINFPQQETFPAYIPLLDELIDSCDNYAQYNNIPLPNYNIELKITDGKDGIYQPFPSEFVELVMSVCKNKNILGRMNIQSFDIRPLQITRQKYPKVKIAYLTSNKKSVKENCEELGFVPDIFSPYYEGVTEYMVQDCHRLGMLIIPWTVNTKNEIDYLIYSMKVDGIITDYPDLF